MHINVCVNKCIKDRKIITFQRTQHMYSLNCLTFAIGPSGAMLVSFSPIIGTQGKCKMCPLYRWAKLRPSRAGN